jgi:hypothetical protein
VDPKPIDPAHADDDRERLLVPTTTAHATPAALALHNNFRSAVRSLQRDLVRTLGYLVAIHDRKVHRALGYVSIIDYAADVAGFSRSQTETFLALGRRIDRYPQVRRALSEGTLAWSKARLIVERAQPHEEDRWLALARQSSVRALAEALSSARQVLAGTRATVTVPPLALQASPPTPALPVPEGTTIPVSDYTPAPPPPADVCHVTYAFTPEEYARWTGAHETLRRHGHRGSNAQLLVDALTRFAEGDDSRGPHGPRYLLQIQLCPTCGQAAINTSRGRHTAAPALLSASQCDAIVEDNDHRRRSVIPPRLRREVLQRDGHRCQAPGCDHMAFLEIHHRQPLAAGGRTTAENLLTLCAQCHRELHRREDDLRGACRDPAAG